MIKHPLVFPFLVSVSLSLAAPLSAEALQFKTDSIGHHPAAPKVALLEEFPAASLEEKRPRILLVDPAKKDLLKKEKVVYEIKDYRIIKDPVKAGPQTATLVLNFSDFKVPGLYRIKVDGTETVSQPVKVSEFLYWDTLKPVVRALYLQRCGWDINDSITGLSHRACHLNDARPPEDGIEDERDATGGWHDSGDYNKYMATTSLATAKLLALYERHPKPFQYLQLDYPPTEPGIGEVPDFLHEIKVGLDWIMGMQRLDGGVYRKVAGREWPGKVLPEEDTQERFIYGVTTQDTAGAAATLAMASRAYKKKDLGYAVKTLLAAEKAWRYLETHPSAADVRSDDASGSLEYLEAKGSGTNAQETFKDLPWRVWAAAELYLATGKPKYHTYFLKNFKTVPVEPITWKNPALQGLLDYALASQSKDAAAEALIREKVLAIADPLADRLQRPPYYIGLRQFGAESNAKILEQASLLLGAYRLTNETRYRDAATRSLHFLFGVNPQGQTFLTSNTPETPGVRHPAHRMLEAARNNVPGLLVSGPNPEATDPKTPKKLGASSYIDDAGAFSSNEPRILYNASLANVLGGLNGAYNEAPAGGEEKSAKE